MKFSILVPVYNVEKYLEQCVESLLNQTYKGEYEIILVDDGSTDSSGKICDKYSENHPDKIKVIHKANGGHTSARLEAIKNAEGDRHILARLQYRNGDSPLRKQCDGRLSIACRTLLFSEARP